MTSTPLLPPAPVLETDRIVLCPLQQHDVPAMQRRFPRWEVVRYLNPLKGGPDELVGVIDLWPDDGVSRDQRGFWLDPEFHGRGLMTEAAERVTAFAFVELGWPHLWLSNAVENGASGRIKEKQGAQLVDRAPFRFLGGDGMRMVWLLRREDWLARRAV